MDKKIKNEKKNTEELAEFISNEFYKPFDLMEWLEQSRYGVTIKGDEITLELEYAMDVLEVIESYLEDLMDMWNVEQKDIKAVAKFIKLLEFVKSNKEFLDMIYFNKKANLDDIDLIEKMLKEDKK